MRLVFKNRNPITLEVLFPFILLVANLAYSAESSPERCRRTQCDAECVVRSSEACDKCVIRCLRPIHLWPEGINESTETYDSGNATVVPEDANGAAQEESCRTLEAI